MGLRHRGDPVGLGVAAGTERAAASYYALLKSDRALAARTYEALRQAHVDQRLMIRDRMLCNVLRPRFITAGESAELSRIAQTLAGVLDRAGAILLSSDSAMDRVGASDEEREIWRTDPGYQGFAATSRLDSFWGREGLRFIEYNAESPAAIGFCDCLTEVFEELPAMAAWGACGPQPKDGRQRLLQVLLDVYREWGGTGQPTIAVIDWQDVITRRDFELCAEHFQQQGIETIICDPRDLRYAGGKLRRGDTAVDLIYRRVLLHELLAKASEARDLLQAYGDGAVCIVNSPRSKLLHKKILFAFLSDRSLGFELSDEEQAIVEGTVPWTRCVGATRTEFHGTMVDLPRLLVAEKDRFVLKPVDDYGGRGVVLGWETSPEDWDKALDVASNGDYIVQEKVDIPSEEYAIWGDGEVELVPLMQDTDPLLFRGDMGSILTRLSGHALLNVTAGSGSTTPTFVVDGD